MAATPPTGAARRAEAHYTMQLKSRALAAVAAQSGRAQWLAGSTAAREENEVRLLEYDPDREALVSGGVWLHPDEVWDIAPSPLAADRMATVHSREGRTGVTVWQAEQGGARLAPLARLDIAGAGGAGTGAAAAPIARRALWSQPEPEALLTIDSAALRRWDLGGGGARCAAAVPARDGEPLWGGAAHPRDGAGRAAAVAGGALLIIDSRAGGAGAIAAEAPRAHRVAARDAHWAPHHAHRLVTCGDDGRVRFWDDRALGRAAVPLLDLGGHAHWVWAARFSPFHDQLVASASTDCSVALYYAPRQAKLRDAPGAAGGIGGGGSGSGGGSTGTPRGRGAGAGGFGDADGRAAVFDEAHEDSVYGLAWSAADPWLLASMSYDGRVVVSAVPKAVKYKILV